MRTYTTKAPWSKKLDEITGIWGDGRRLVRAVTSAKSENLVFRSSDGREYRITLGKRKR